MNFTGLVIFTLYVKLYSLYRSRHDPRIRVQSARQRPTSLHPTNMLQPPGGA